MNRNNTHSFSFFALGLLMVLYGLTTAGYMGPNPIGESSNLSQPLIVPAGYAFAIWTPIYLFLLVFPFYQWFKRPVGEAGWNQLRTWYGINVITNGLWLVAASYDFLWATVALILLLLYSLVRIYKILGQLKGTGEKPNYWTEEVGFTIYFAWITIATVLNITGALKYYGWDGFEWPETSWALVILLVTALLAAWIAWRIKEVPYALVVIWAFVAIMVKNWNTYENLAYLATGVAIFFSLFSLMIYRRKRSLNNRELSS